MLRCWSPNLINRVNRAALPALVWAAVSGMALADGPRWVTQLVRRLPRSIAEVEEAFEKSKNASIQISPGEPMEVPGFTQETVFDVTVAGKKEKLKFQFGRVGAISFGLEVSEADQQNLPAVSKGRIMKRIDENFISTQIRPQRDVSTGAIYLYHKPFAAIGSYFEAPTQEFSPLMEDSVRDFRGLGLFVKPGTAITAENLRTFVGLNKTMITDEKDPFAAKPALFPNFEFVFVRAKIEGEKIDLHAFLTTEHRRRLNYLKPYQPPKSPDECSIKSVLLFTDYSVAKQSPSAKAIRKAYVNAQASYPIEALDQFAADQKWDGDALDNLTTLLDAIISGQVLEGGK